MDHIECTCACFTSESSCLSLQLYLLQRDYRAALAQYTEALSLAHHTEGANAIRLGIGICHINLGDLNLARLAFERVFTLDESSAEALSGLAAVDLLAPEGTIDRFVDLLTAAYRLDPHSPPLNTALAQFHLVRGDVLAAEAYAHVAVRQPACMLHQTFRSCSWCICASGSSYRRHNYV